MKSHNASMALGYAPAAARLSTPPGVTRAALARTYRQMLERLFAAPAGAFVRFVEGAFDSGTRVPTVFVEYDSTDPVASRFAWQVSQQAPLDWDTDSREQLRRAGANLA